VAKSSYGKLCWQFTAVLDDPKVADDTRAEAEYRSGLETALKIV
jgi:hypothetical protein